MTTRTDEQADTLGRRAYQAYMSSLYHGTRSRYSAWTTLPESIKRDWLAVARRVMEDQPMAEVHLAPHAFNVSVHGPAIVHLDDVRSMTGCSFQDCTLMYKGKEVSGLAEWIRLSGGMDDLAMAEAARSGEKRTVSLTADGYLEKIIELAGSLAEGEAQKVSDALNGAKMAMAGASGVLGFVKTIRVARELVRP